MFWGNIAARPLRSLLSVLAIAIQVILVLMIVGLTSGLIPNGESARRRGRGYLVQPPKALFSFILERGKWRRAGDQIEVLPDVTLWPHRDVSTSRRISYGLWNRLQALQRAEPRFLYRSGRAFPGADEVLADDNHRATKALKVATTSRC